MFRKRKFTVTEELVTLAAAAIQSTKYRNGALRPDDKPDTPTVHDYRYARAALEAVATHLDGSQ